jgi:putative nucleotidyltransferase with HDIG domain
MDNEFISKVLADRKQLLSLPQTLAEVLRVTRDEKSSSRDLEAVIQRDPALTARILRIVNSAYYGLNREAGTVNQAVVTIGTRAVTALALSSSVYKMTSEWRTTTDPVRFWRHSLEVAIASRMVAQAAGYQFADEAFVAGLLHDIGILVLEDAFPDKFKEIKKRLSRGENLADIEDEIWGTNHARVGKFLLEQWKLPVRICDAVGRHHTTFSPETISPDHVLDQIVCLANHLSRFSIIENVQPDIATAATNRDILQGNLRLTTEAVIKLEEQLFTRTLAEARYLEIEVGSSEELLMEANKLLFKQYVTVENLLRDNRRMQQQIARDQMKKLALESLKTITATLNHYMNNASATILGRAQLVEYGITNGRIIDSDGSLSTAMNVITGGVNTISAVMEELKNLASFDTTVYHAETYILDIERKIKAQLEKLQEPVEVA